MSEPEKPKFSIWLGDNWPGPYIVTYDLGKGKQRTVVVNGVASMEDACAVANAEFPSDEHASIAITIGHVAEASHHIEMLAAFHAKNAEQRELGKP